GFHLVRVGLGEVLGGPVVRQLHYLEVGFHQLGASAEVVNERILDHLGGHPEQVSHHSNVGHVGYVLLDLAFHLYVGEQLFDRYRVVDEVGTVGAEAQVGVVNAHAAGRQGGYVFGHG